MEVNILVLLVQSYWLKCHWLKSFCKACLTKIPLNLTDKEANFDIFFRKKCLRLCISRCYSDHHNKNKKMKNICFLNIKPLCSWLMLTGVGCTQKHRTLNHLYAGGRQLFVTDYPKQHAPSPLRGGRCYFSRSITGGAVSCFRERECVCQGWAQNGFIYIVYVFCFVFNVVWVREHVRII